MINGNAWCMTNSNAHHLIAHYRMTTPCNCSNRSSFTLHTSITSPT